MTRKPTATVADDTTTLTARANPGGSVTATATTTDDTPAEPSHRWRRFYTYAGGVLSLGLVLFIIIKLPGGAHDPLKWIAIALITGNIVRESWYMGGASLNDWALVTKAWRPNPSISIGRPAAEHEPREEDDK